MRKTSIAIVIALAALAAATNGAQAKPGVWILTGGSLGEGVFPFSLQALGADPNVGLLEGAQRTTTPVPEPDLVYVLHPQSALATDERGAQEGALIWYAPRVRLARLLQGHDGLAAGWYEVPPRTVSLLDAAISLAEAEQTDDARVASPMDALLARGGLGEDRALRQPGAGNGEAIVPWIAVALVFAAVTAVAVRRPR